MMPERVAATREAEQRTAAAILGIQQVSFLDFKDGELAWTGPALAEVATRLIRVHRPGTIVTHDPYAGAPSYGVPQLHPDHRAVGAAVLEACYFRAPGPLYYPAHAAGGLAPHHTHELLLIMGEHRDYAVDITSTFARKVAAVRAHASQFGMHPDVEGFLRNLATRAGAPFDLHLAEGFKRLTP